MSRFPASDSCPQTGSTTLLPWSGPNATDPFLKYSKKSAHGQLARRLEAVPRLPSKWQQVMSYAWAIFRQVSKFETSWDIACEWGTAFDRAFTLPYVNIVLPACYHALGDPFGRLLRHLQQLLLQFFRVEGTKDAETMKLYLVCLSDMLTQYSKQRLNESLPTHAGTC